MSSPPSTPEDGPRGGLGASMRRRPATSLALQAILVVMVAVPVVHFEVDRWRRGRAIEEHVHAGDRAFAGGDYELASAAYAHALALDPASPDLALLQRRGRAYLVADQPQIVRQEQLAELRYEIQRQLAADAAHTAAYLTARAVVLGRLGDKQGANAALEAALSRDASFPLARFALAERDVAAGRKDEARKHYEAVLERRPDHVGSLVGLASIDLDADRIDAAIERLKRALALRDELATRLALVDALVKKGALKEALVEGERAAAENAESAEAHQSLGLIHSLMNRLPEAEREYRAALAIKVSAQGFVDLAGVLGEQKRSKEALQSYKRALREEPSNPVALLWAAMAANDSGLADEAMELLRKLLALPREGADKDRVTSLQAMARKRSRRSYIGAPSRAIRQMSPMPCSVLRDGVTGRARRRRAARDRGRRGCGWRRCRRAGRSLRSASRLVRWRRGTAARRACPRPGARPPAAGRGRSRRDSARPNAANRGRAAARRPRDHGAGRGTGLPRSPTRRSGDRTTSAPARSRRKRGAVVRQIAIACGQRGWKWQPGGGASGDGISPLIGTNVRFLGSTLPTSASSACVYGWFGAA